jgi:hypothetical protein
MDFRVVCQYIFGIFIYMVTFGCAAFAVFVLGRRTEKKERKTREEIEQINSMISDLEK